MTLVYDPRPDTPCLGHLPGTDALMRAAGERFGTTTDGQTFVCKKISGSDNWSYHAFGMSGDSSGYFERLEAQAQGFLDKWELLGLQEMIFDHHRWSTETGALVKKPFGGSDPHTSHIHWTLNLDSAKNKTYEYFVAVLAGRAVPNQEEEFIVDENTQKQIALIVNAAIAESCKEGGAIWKALNANNGDIVGDLGKDKFGRTVRPTVANAIKVIKPNP